MLFKKICSLNQKIKEYRLRKYENQGIVYMFHDITEHATSGMYTIGVDNFKSLLEYSISQGEVISSKDLERESQSQCFVVTFDDAYESVFLLAFPVLKELRCPFTIFMSLEYLDEEGYLNENMLKEMVNSGLCTLGYHALEHTFFRTKEEKEKERLLKEGREKLQKIANRNIEDFAFPYGSVYAVDSKSIRIAQNYYKRVYLTLSAHYNRECIKRLKYIPRISINDCMAQNILRGN